MSLDERLDVIMRLHDSRRLTELQRAVFSVMGQSYRPIHLNLCTQRFTRGMILDVRDALAPLLALHGAPTLDIHNYEERLPQDARSALANLGLAVANGRYAAFLDYDDTIYPEAYALLTHRLRESGAAIAFGGIAVKRADIEDGIFYVRSKQRPWRGKSVLDQFNANFCPIHSFVMDRTRLPEDLRFERDLSRHEDYDFLLRACAVSRSDFMQVESVIGDYYVKSDGSNSILTESSFTDANRAEWRQAETFVEQRRRTTVVAPEVQVEAGLRTAVPGLTIRGLLDRLGRSVARAA